MQRHFGFAVLAALCMLVAACSGTTIVTNYAERADPTQGRNVVVFMDGTSNDLNSTTNVSRLHAFAKNQNRQDLVSFYSSGVGADGTAAIGAITGYGIGRDVRSAYRFLSENWRDGQDVAHLYGYSRGAYAARILAGFIFTAGLVDITKVDTASGPPRPTTSQERDMLVLELYNAYKGDRSLHLRRDRVESVVSRHGLSRKQQHDTFRFAVVGLWETVEALGWPDFRENFSSPNDRYIDQICNMERVFHAAALDDNRATVYTPILISLPHLTKHCPERNAGPNRHQVEEVWFSGAHADVGGGLGQGYLSGVSLNWMLANVRQIGVAGRSVFPQDAGVYADPLDLVHDMRRYNLVFRGFPNRMRKVEKYHRAGNLSLKLHASVLHRIAHQAQIIEPQARPNRSGRDANALGQELWTGFSHCIDLHAVQVKRRPDCAWIEIVSDP